MTNNFDDNENNNNSDEFVEPEVGVSEGNEKRTSISGNLVEAWRTRPLFKFMVMIAGVFLVGVALVSFLSGPADSESARLSKPPTLNEPPGGAASPYMIKQTELATAARAEAARLSGGSAIPTPIGEKTDIGGLGNGDKKEDPLKELRLEMEAQRRQMQQQQVQIQQRPPEPFDNSLAEAMQRQMNQLLASWVPVGMKSVTVVNAEDLKAEQERLAKELADSKNALRGLSVEEKAKIIVNSGTVSYAQLLTEANSDVPGPILAQIVSGPLSGARAIGSFQVADGYEKYLVLRFFIANKKGKDYQIDAIALDPNTTLGGLATEVDERYFTRVVLPAAASFLQGLGSAMGQNNTSYILNGNSTIVTHAREGFKEGVYNGLGTAADTMGKFFQHQADVTKPLVRVAAGSPMGLFFVGPVMDPSASTTVVPQQRPINNMIPSANTNSVYNATNPNNAPYANYPGTMANGYNMPVANYPGTTVTGYGANIQNTGNVSYPGNMPYGYVNNPLNPTTTTYPYGASYGTMGYPQQNYGR